MNLYGAKAQNHWKQHLPQQYDEIPPNEREAFFAAKGEEIQAAIEALAAQIAGPDRPGEEFLGKVGRLNEARMTAQDEVLREMLPKPDTDHNEPMVR